MFPLVATAEITGMTASTAPLSAGAAPQTDAAGQLLSHLFGHSDPLAGADPFLRNNGIFQSLQAPVSPADGAIGSVHPLAQSVLPSAPPDIAGTAGGNALSQVAQAVPAPADGGVLASFYHGAQAVTQNAADWAQGAMHAVAPIVANAAPYLAAAGAVALGAYLTYKGGEKFLSWARGSGNSPQEPKPKSGVLRSVLKTGVSAAAMIAATTVIAAVGWAWMAAVALVTVTAGGAKQLLSSKEKSAEKKEQSPPRPNVPRQNRSTVLAMP